MLQYQVPKDTDATRVGKGKPQKLPREGNIWGSEPSKFEYKEAMIREIFVYNLVYSVWNCKIKFLFIYIYIFFLSDL